MLTFHLLSYPEYVSKRQQISILHLIQTVSICTVLLPVFHDADMDVGSDALNRQPFAVDIPGSCGYVTRMTDGVMRVYATQSSLDNDSPLNYPYPDLMQFLADQNLLFCLIADGPL